MMRIEIPEDVKEFLIIVQANKKIEKRGGHYSLEQTIVHLLRELMGLKGFQTQRIKEEKKEEH